MSTGYIYIHMYTYTESVCIYNKILRYRAPVPPGGEPLEHLALNRASFRRLCIYILPVMYMYREEDSESVCIYNERGCRAPVISRGGALVCLALCRASFRPLYMYIFVYLLEYIGRYIHRVFIYNERGYRAPVPPRGVLLVCLAQGQASFRPRGAGGVVRNQGAFRVEGARIEPVVTK